MAYKVFISHSTCDQWLVMTLANILSKFGVQVFVAEWYLAPGEKLSKKVFTQIENSNCVIALLTQNGIRSNWVQQEIGFALKTKRLLIPLVEKGLAAKELGALQGTDYIEYDPSYPKEALVRTSTYVKSLKLRKDEEEKTLLIAGGIIAFLLLIFGGGKK